MAGYSGKSLADKLGIREGRKALFVSAPPGYDATLGTLPQPSARIDAGLAQACSKTLARQAPFDFIQAFCRTDGELAKTFPALKALIPADGMIWISWPKRVKGRTPAPGELTETRVRELGLAAGLVDVKVCAVDATWSGLKFVLRLKDRG